MKDTNMRMTTHLVQYVIPSDECGRGAEGSLHSGALGQDDTHGFTLLETLIYIGLFTFIIGGGLISVLYIIDSAEKTKHVTDVAAEVSFMLAKVQWAIYGASSISTTVDPLQLLVSNAGGAYVFAFDAMHGQLTLRQNGGDAMPLNTNRVPITHASFVKTVAVGQPDRIEIALMIEGVPYSTTYYMR